MDASEYDSNGCLGDPCFPGTICTDVPNPDSGFTCGDCPLGYAGDGITCVDVDDCAVSPCGDNGLSCVDMGVWQWECTCAEGYRFDGQTCALPVGYTAAFTRFGSRSCPEQSTHLYEGFTASKHYSHPGGGMDFICMHPEPQFPPGHSDGDHNGNLLYGVEYENTGSVDANHDGDAA